VIFNPHEAVVEFREFVEHHLFKPGQLCIKQFLEVAEAIIKVAKASVQIGEAIIHIGSQVRNPAIVVQKSNHDDGERTHKRGKREKNLYVGHG
jgi:hypothetical protein